MEDRHEAFRAIVQQFVKIVNRYTALEKTAFDFGIGQKLFPSEIHTIEAIGNHEGINVTDLAGAMGVTKGAISQMISKLATKGLVKRKKTPDNDKEVALYLNPLGRKAYQGHVRFHQEMYAELLGMLETVPMEEFGLFSRMLEKIDASLENYYYRTKE